MPTSERTEYRPPMWLLCSIKNKLNFFDRLNKMLFFFCEIIITFLAFFFKILRINKFDKVSIVLPDYDTIKKRVLDSLTFFLKFLIFSLSKSLKKKISFFIFFLKN